MPETLIHLHREALPKPLEGAPCNGCGVCCAVETCPVARLRFLKKTGPCPALAWDGDNKHYRCGLLIEPGRYFPGLPAAWAKRLFSRWIAAGKGCDCDFEPTQPPA